MPYKHYTNYIRLLSSGRIADVRSQKVCNWFVKFFESGSTRGYVVIPFCGNYTTAMNFNTAFKYYPLRFSQTETELLDVSVHME